MSNEYLGWPEDTAGAEMDTDFIAVSSKLTVKESTHYLRDLQEKYPKIDLGTTEIQSIIYVVDELGDNVEKLLGFVTFRQLLFEKRRALNITKIMTPVKKMVTVNPLMDQQKAATVLYKHKLLAVPVVDKKGLILGVITVDDAHEIMEDERDEDVAKQSAQAVLETPYLKTSSFRLWRNRIVWLLLLFIAEFFTSSILKGYEEELEKCIALSFFIPLITSIGGNSASQVVGTLIRVMETEGVNIKNIFAVIRKELATASMLGIVMASVGFFRAWTLGVGINIMITVGISVLIVVIWSGFMSGILPLILKKLKLDPAVMSAAMLATLVDALGLIILFTVADIFVF
jgi:magnesium transporter